MFVFRLQSVLDARKAIEEKRLLAFAEARRILDAEEERLHAIRRKRSVLAEELGRDRKSVRPAREVVMAMAYLERLRGEEREQESKVNALQRETEQRRSELLEAMKQRKIMDRLRSVRFGEYEQERKRREQAESDERSVLRFERVKP